jgi:hypothetical protein
VLNSGRLQRINACRGRTLQIFEASTAGCESNRGCIVQQRFSGNFKNLTLLLIRRNLSLCLAPNLDFDSVWLPVPLFIPVYIFWNSFIV